MNIASETVNVVAKATLDRNIDLPSFQQKFPKDFTYGSDYYHGRFAHFKSEEMQGRVALWPSGKMMGMGTKTPKRAILELNMVAKKLGAVFKVWPTISNIVTLADIDSQIDLERCVSALEVEGMQVIYEPEQFSGIIARFKMPFKEKEISVLIFSSGKLIIPGLRNTEEIDIVLKKCIVVLKKCIGVR